MAVGVEIPGTHPQPPETASQCPSSHGGSGQIVPGVHGGQITQVPLHGTPLQGPVGVGIGVGVGVAVSVGSGVGKVQAILQQISLPSRHSHAPQQQPHVVPRGQLFTNGLHSLGVGAGVGVGVARSTQLQIVHPPTDSHTFSYSGRHWNGGSGGQVGVGVGVATVTSVQVPL